MNKLLIPILLITLIFSQGCMSYMSYKASEREIIGRRVYASGDEAAIKAFAVGDTVGIGVNVLAYEAITEHPWRQLGCAVVDAGTAWAANELIQRANEDDKDKDNGSLDVSGSYNTVTYTVIKEIKQSDVRVKRDSKEEVVE